MRKERNCFFEFHKTWKTEHQYGLSHKKNQAQFFVQYDSCGSKDYWYQAACFRTKYIL